MLPLSEQELIAAYEARVKPALLVAPQRIPLAGGVSHGAVQGQSRQTLIIVIVFGVLVGGLYWFSGGETQRADIKPAAQITEVPVAAADATPTEAQTAESPVAEATPAETPPPASTQIVEPPAVANAAPAEPAVPANQLTLQFLEASWVRVEDSRNKTLLIGLVRAGEKQALNGEPPYTAFIGNARKVRAEFNGQPFDFSRHIQANDTARFIVP